MPALHLGCQLVNRPRYLPFTSTHGTSLCLHTQVPPLTAPLQLSLPLFTPRSPPLLAWSCSLCNQGQPGSHLLLHRNLPCVDFLGRPQQKCHELRHLKSQQPIFSESWGQSSKSRYKQSPPLCKLEEGGGCSQYWLVLTPVWLLSSS